MEERTIIAMMSFAFGSIGFYRACKAITKGYAREGSRRISLREPEEYDRYDQPFKFWCTVAGQMLLGIVFVGFGIFILLWER